MEKTFIYIYFLYGLAFFCMGLVILLETRRSAEERLNYALPALAAFGILHGFHEWYEMFELLDLLPYADQLAHVYEVLRIGLLALSFLSLAIFGAWMFARDARERRQVLLFPLIIIAIWGFGVLVFTSIYGQNNLLPVVDAWTRYILGVPAALAACAGLVFQQREMRRQGMSQFGRDCLWAAVAFFWYGVIGQTFIRTSPLPPSTFWNADLFMQLFGFPVQLLRATAAIIAAVFVIHFLRLFEVEVQRGIRELQEARLKDAERREALRGEMLRRIVAAQEAERQRVARDLHDATGQSLTALGLGLRSVSTQLHQDSGKAEANLYQLEGMVANALEELQRLIADLRPSHLDDLGLPAALRWYTGEIQSRVPLDINLEVNGDGEEIPSEIKIAVFRLVQEALTNVIKHSGAKQASVFVEFDPDLVKVRVEDNGCGFDIETVGTKAHPSWGILGMRERAALLGGELYLFSRRGWGTRIDVELPYQQESQEVGSDHTPVTGR